MDLKWPLVRLGMCFGGLGSRWLSGIVNGSRMAQYGHGWLCWLSEVSRWLGLDMGGVRLV